jgi:hypothetical protein
MSGRLQERLEGFVKRSDDQRKPTQTPSSTQPQPQAQELHARSDRAAAAAAFKVKRGEKATVNPQPAQTLPSTLPAPRYGSNPAAPRNTYPNSRYQQQQPHLSLQDVEPDPGYMLQLEQHLPAQAGAFDDTLTSGLEDTKSDVLYNGAAIGNRSGGSVDDDDYDLQVEEGYVQQDPRHQVRIHGHASKHLAQHGLQHKQSRSPLIDAGAKQQQHRYIGQTTHGISGRFEIVADGHCQQDIANRSGNEHARHTNASNQQSHSEKPGYDDEERVACREQRGMVQPESDDYDDESSDEEESPLPVHQGLGSGCHTQQEGGHNHAEPRTDGAESAVSAVSRRHTLRNEVDRALLARTEEPNWYKIDFDDEKLQKMAYTDLKKEDWDFVASSQKRTNPAGTQHSDITLEDGIKYMVEDETADAQVQFFEEMSMAEYEEAGDFFINKFADLVKQIKDSRKKKRGLVTAFEKEIEEREKAVRVKCENLDKQFNDMRAGGEDVLRGKV